MKICIVTIILVPCVTFLYGLRPGADLYGGWNYSSMSVEDVSASDNYVDLAMTVIAPFDEYIGLRAGVVAVNFGGGGTYIGVAGRIGAIEMIPGYVVSPYFTQQVTMDIYSFDGSSSSNIVLSAGVGVEFLSDSPVSPFFEGRFAWDIMNIDNISGNGIGIGLGGGVRFYVTKNKQIKEKTKESDL